MSHLVPVKYMPLLRSFRDLFGVRAINIALLTELKSDGAPELGVIGFVSDASRIRDQFIIFLLKEGMPLSPSFSRILSRCAESRSALRNAVQRQKAGYCEIVLPIIFPTPSFLAAPGTAVLRARGRRRDHV